MTRSDPAVLGVGDAKGTMATQKVMRSTVSGPGGTVEVLQDVPGYIELCYLDASTHPSLLCSVPLALLCDGEWSC